MTLPITLTFDVEDHRPSPDWESRYEQHTQVLLAFLEARGWRATFFVVGELATRSPELVRAIATAGHEVGLHSYRHWATFSYDPVAFRREMARGRDLLGDLSGQPVAGYRSPAATLMPQSYWATEVLAELGFTYSASILPTQSYLVGFPGAPSTPFRWPSGLVELPCPTVSVGGVGMPFLGGTFLRVLPGWFSRFAARSLPTGSVPWSYLHPYDIDTGERFWVVPEVRWWGSLLLWVNRGVALDRLERLVRGRVGEPLGERVDAIAYDLLSWDPSAARTTGAPTLASLLAQDDRVAAMDRSRVVSTA